METPGQISAEIDTRTLVPELRRLWEQQRVAHCLSACGDIPSLVTIGDEGHKVATVREDDMAKAGVYALGFVLLFGVLVISVGFVLWDILHDQPESLPALIS
jgi:hypothetical protein